MHATDLIQIAEWSGLLFCSLYVLVKCSGIFVEGSKDLGIDIGIPPFLIGVVIVAFGTSLPELVTSVVAAFQGTTAIVVADVVGSNITNILLIMGIMALFYGPVSIDRKMIERGLPVFFISTVLIGFMMFDHTVNRLEAVMLVGIFLVYFISLLYEPLKKETSEMEDLLTPKRPLFSGFASIGLIVVGLCGLLIGAHYTVEMSVHLAYAFSVPVDIISILGISIGTSLPELFVSLHAFRLGETDVALGNIYGTNAFNVLMALGVPALITPISADAMITHLGLPIMIIASVFLLLKGFSSSIKRWEGFMMLSLFVFFLIGLLHYL